MRIPIEFVGADAPFKGGERQIPRARGPRGPRPASPRPPVRNSDPEPWPEPLRAGERPFTPRDRRGEPVEKDDPSPQQARGTPERPDEAPGGIGPEPLSGASEDVWRDRYLRLKADLENVKRHAEAERALLSAQGKDAVLEDLFPVVDHLQRAIRAAREDGREGPGILEGIEMVYRELMGVLEKHGVDRIEALGKPFDPRIHDAVAVRDHPEHARNTVLEELRNGFARGDILLRPATVVVAA